MRLLNPFAIARYARDLRTVGRGGGPQSVRLVRLGEPEGLLIPSSEAVVEVEARDGTKVRLNPQIPMPFLVGWSIRLARLLRVPLISDLQPESFEIRVALPGRSG
jgi:hypothetical protein